MVAEESRVERLEAEVAILRKKIEELKEANATLKEFINQLELVNNALRTEVREMLEEAYTIRFEIPLWEP